MKNSKEKDDGMKSKGTEFNWSELKLEDKVEITVTEHGVLDDGEYETYKEVLVMAHNESKERTDKIIVFCKFGFGAILVTKRDDGVNVLFENPNTQYEFESLGTKCSYHQVISAVKCKQVEAREEVILS